MNTWQQALSKAAATVHWTTRMCDNFVANLYGFAASGFNTALDHWNATPGTMKHPGDFNAPAGALMFWGGGAGHVAISDGQGGIYSTDMPSTGDVGHVPASTISKQWGKPYLGWSLPYFNGLGANVGASSGASATNAAYKPFSGSALDYVTKSFGSDIKDIVERAGLILMGGVLIIVGLFLGPGKEILVGVTGNAKEGGEKTISNSQKAGV